MKRHVQLEFNNTDGPVRVTESTFLNWVREYANCPATSNTNRAAIGLAGSNPRAVQLDAELRSLRRDDQTWQGREQLGKALRLLHELWPEVDFPGSPDLPGSPQ